VSGQVPFDDIPKHKDIVTAITERKGPLSLSESDASMQGFKPVIWALITQCWNQNASRRPSIERFIKQLSPAEPAASRSLHNANSEQGTRGTEQEQRDQPNTNPGVGMVSEPEGGKPSESDSKAALPVEGTHKSKCCGCCVQ
jgi:hypothetical protein